MQQRELLRVIASIYTPLFWFGFNYYKLTNEQVIEERTPNSGERNYIKHKLIISFL
jgi:hypothetical protein